MAERHPAPGHRAVAHAAEVLVPERGGQVRLGRVGVRARGALRVVRMDQRDVGEREFGCGGGRGEDQLGRRLDEDRLPLCRSLVGAQQGVAGPCLQGPEQCDRQLRGAFHGQPDHRLGSRAPADQAVGQSVGAGVQLPEGQRGVPEDHRDRVGCGGRVLLEERHHRP